MNCRQIRTELASWIGEPLDAETEQRLRRHLTDCPQCHAWYRQLQDSLKLLHHLECRPAEPDGLSLWPRLEPQIGEPHSSSSQHGGSSAWIVLLALTALAGLALGLVPQILPSSATGAARPEPMAGRPDVRPLAPWRGERSELQWSTANEQDPWGGVFASPVPFQVPEPGLPVDLSRPGRHSAVLILEYDCPHCGRCVTGALRWHRSRAQHAEAP